MNITKNICNHNILSIKAIHHSQSDESSLVFDLTNFEKHREAHQNDKELQLKGIILLTSTVSNLSSK